MNGTLLCGIADADEDAGAVRVAMDLAHRLDLRVILVHVVHIPQRGTAAADDEVYWRDRHGAAAMLTDLAKTMQMDGSVERRVVVGDATSSIAMVAAEEAADLIVIGGRPRRTLLRARSSSFATQLTHDTDIPVVIAPVLGRARRAKRAPAALVS